jgi:hypothetical protein
MHEGSVLDLSICHLFETGEPCQLLIAVDQWTLPGLCAKYSALPRHLSYALHDGRSHVLSQGPALLRAVCLNPAE